MMFQKGRFRHGRSPTFLSCCFKITHAQMLFVAAVEELQANLLEMPFLGDDVSFFALLPEGNNNGSLEATISHLTLETLRDAMSRTFPVTVEVGIPKFRMEQTLSLRSVGYPSLNFYNPDQNVALLTGFGQDGLNRHVRLNGGWFIRL